MLICGLLFKIRCVKGLWEDEYGQTKKSKISKKNRYKSQITRICSVEYLEDVCELMWKKGKNFERISPNVMHLIDCTGTRSVIVALK